MSQVFANPPRTPRAQRFVLMLPALGALFLGASCSRAKEKPSPPPATSAAPADAPPTKRVVGPLSKDDARALATMNDRIRDYIDLHSKLERGLPKLPNNATPQQIDRTQRVFEARIRKARATAHRGDIFTADAEPVIRRLLATVFAGPEGKQLKASIMDENVVDPATIKIGLNSRYPDTVPLTSIPPEVLQTLPRLGEDLEYRFIGDWLILLDTHAHTVADFIPDVLPN
jgi:hypothetical protein